MVKDVAVFLDLDNLIIAARQVNVPFDINLILEHLKKLTDGRIVLRRAYGDWRQTQKVPEDLALAGFELQSIVRLSNVSKNLADMQMVVDAMETLIDGHEFSTYVLMTGDRDFTPLVQTLRKRGRVVIGVGFRHTASRSLVHLCDDYVYYEDLLPSHITPKLPADVAHRPETPAQPAAPAEESDNGVPLSVRYARALKKLGVRAVPAPARLVVLKELADFLTTNEQVEWGDIVRSIYERHRNDADTELSKNLINSVLIVAKRAGIMHVNRGKTLSTAPVQLAVNDRKAFQEAVLRTDAFYLREIAAMDMPFDLSEAAVTLYDSNAHARYLKIVHNRYNVNGSGS